MIRSYDLTELVNEARMRLWSSMAVMRVHFSPAHGDHKWVEPSC